MTWVFRWFGMFGPYSGTRRHRRIRNVTALRMRCDTTTQQDPDDDQHRRHRHAQGEP